MEKTEPKYSDIVVLDTGHVGVVQKIHHHFVLHEPNWRSYDVEVVWHGNRLRDLVNKHIHTVVTDELIVQLLERLGEPDE